MMQWTIAIAVAAGAALAGAAAQTPPGAPTAARPAEQPEPAGQSAAPDLEEVLRDLARAHGGDAAARGAKGFQGKLAITPTARDADKITIVLDVRFQLPDRMRYMVDEGERRAERGRDDRGPWVRLAEGDPAESVMGRGGEGDREQLDKHIALARQLLSYVDPAGVARQLRDPVVAAEALRINRHKSVPCLTVAGIAEDFPLYHLGGAPTRVELKLWIDAATKLLIAVEAFPAAAGDPAPSGELILMPRHREQDGVRLPFDLVFDEIDRDGHRQPQSKISIVQLELDPALPAEKFARDVPWGR